MGMYTELCAAFDLEKTTPPQVTKFLAWLSPYIVVGQAWQYIGTTRYEQDPLPTLVIVQRDPRRIHLRTLNGKIMQELNDHVVTS